MARRRKKDGLKVDDRAMLRELLWQNRNRLSDQTARDVLEQLSARLPLMGEHLAWLAAYDTDSRIWHMAALLLFSAMRESCLPAPVLSRMQETARPVLLAALRDEQVSDQRKYTLGPIHHLVGGEMSREEYEGCFKDFEGTLHGMMENIFERISDQPHDVERMLTDMGLLPPDDDDLTASKQPSAQSLLHICDHLRGRNDAAAAMLLGSAVAAGAHVGLPEEEMRAMVEMLGATRCDRSAWCLSELARWPALGELTPIVEHHAQEALAAGLPPRAGVLSDFSHALVSTVDASGTRSVLVFYRTGEGGMDGVVLLLNDREGIRDAWAVFGDGSVVEERWRDNGPEGIQFAQVRLEFVRDLLGEAMALHHEHARPLPGRLFLLRPYFGSEPIPARRRTPNLGSYMLELMTIGPQLVEGSEDLVNSPLFGNMAFCGDAVYDYLRHNLPRRGPCRLKKDKLVELARDVASLERKTLLDRTAANLEIESLGGRGIRPDNRLAAATWLGLTNEVVPFEKVGYILELCKLSVERVGESVRAGFKNQQEANEANLALGRRLAEMEDEFEAGLDDDEDDPDDRNWGENLF